MRWSYWYSLAVCVFVVILGLIHLSPPVVPIGSGSIAVTGAVLLYSYRV